MATAPVSQVCIAGNAGKFLIHGHNRQVENVQKILKSGLRDGLLLQTLNNQMSLKPRYGADFW